MDNPTAGIIIIGNEILSGRTADQNLGHIAAKLGEHGVRVAQAKVIADIEDEIINTVLEYSKSYDYVFTTGGIGPTHDDITAACVAKAFNVALETNVDALRVIESCWGKTGEHGTIMAKMPVGSRMIENPISASPGFAIENVYVMAGIPEVMRAMLESIIATIKHGDPIRSQTVRCFLGESLIAKGLEEIQNKYPQVEIGSYPFWNRGTFGASIVIRGTDNLIILKGVKDVVTMIKDLGGEATIEVA